MNVSENRSLKAYNTFGIEANARYFAEFTVEEQAIAFLSSLPPEQLPLLILGQGSNILFTTDFPGTVVRLETKGIKVIEETPDLILVKVSGGEIWDEFVTYCVEHGWGGVENLSLIPGKVGAAPIQNIGAYGIEIQEVFEELEAVHLETAERKIFRLSECGFGYRTSIFKTLLKGQYLILNVTFRLSKKPELKLNYGSLREELETLHLDKPTIKDVREVVCRIRRSKLPDPSVTGNAGSFFKNPVIRSDQFEQLRNDYPAVISYPDPNGVKLAAAWLIEHCGWKGRRTGDAGVHPRQPLVLVNYGNATGKEILDLASMIRQSVLSRFGILLEPEVNII